MEPYRIAVRRSWMREGLAQGRSILVRLPPPHPATTKQQAAKSAQPSPPRERDKRMAGLQSALSMFSLPFTGGG